MFHITSFRHLLLTGILVMAMVDSLAGQCSQDLRDALADLIVWNTKWREGSLSSGVTALNGQSVFVLESDSQVSFVSAKLRFNATIYKNKAKLVGTARLGEYYKSDSDESIIQRMLSTYSSGAGCLQLRESEMARNAPDKDISIMLPRIRICEKGVPDHQVGEPNVTVRSCVITIPKRAETMPIVRAESKALVKMLEVDMSQNGVADSGLCNNISFIIPYTSVFAPWTFVLVENSCEKTMNTIYMIYRDGSSYMIGREIPYDNSEFSRLAPLIWQSTHEKKKAKLRGTSR